MDTNRPHRAGKGVAMTVRELMELLATLPADLPVVLSKDAEGNRFSPLSDWSAGRYEPDSTWSGEFYTWEDHAGTKEIAIGDSNAICLWPVN